MSEFKLGEEKTGQAEKSVRCEQMAGDTCRAELYGPGNGLGMTVKAATVVKLSVGECVGRVKAEQSVENGRGVEMKGQAEKSARSRRGEGSQAEQFSVGESVERVQTEKPDRVEGCEESKSQAEQLAGEEGGKGGQAERCGRVEDKQTSGEMLDMQKQEDMLTNVQSQEEMHPGELNPVQTSHTYHNTLPLTIPRAVARYVELPIGNNVLHLLTDTFKPGTCRADLDQTEQTGKETLGRTVSDQAEHFGKEKMGQADRDRDVGPAKKNQAEHFGRKKVGRADVNQAEQIGRKKVGSADSDQAEQIGREKVGQADLDQAEQTSRNNVGQVYKDRAEHIGGRKVGKDDLDQAEQVGRKKFEREKCWKELARDEKGSLVTMKVIDRRLEYSTKKKLQPVKKLPPRKLPPRKLPQERVSENTLPTKIPPK